MTEIEVARLTRRLADTPQDFLASPTEMSVPAVVSDLLLTAGGTALNASSAQRFEANPGRGRRRLRLVLITCWLLADEQLLAAAGTGAAPRADRLLAKGLDELADIIDARRFVTEPERREELARVTLRAMKVRPAGETQEQAEDRLSAVDSARRHQVFVAAREAEKRAEEIRKAMEEKRAKEAAARYSQV